MNFASLWFWGKLGGKIFRQICCRGSDAIFRTVSVGVVCLLFLGFFSAQALLQGNSLFPSTANLASVRVIMALMDINIATKEELMKPPGGGRAYSEKIIQGRPYKGMNEPAARNIPPPGYL
jgi:competence protein ComEA